MYQRQINLRNFLNAAFRLSGSASNNDDYDNELIFPLNHNNITTHTHTHTCTLCVCTIFMNGIYNAGTGAEEGAGAGTGHKRMISVECTNMSRSLYNYT